MQVIFTTQSGIPDNGKITIKLDTRWRVLGDCEVENLTPLVSGGSVSCEK